MCQSVGMLSHIRYGTIMVPAMMWNAFEAGWCEGEVIKIRFWLWTRVSAGVIWQCPNKLVRSQNVPEEEKFACFSFPKAGFFETVLFFVEMYVWPLSCNVSGIWLLRAGWLTCWLSCLTPLIGQTSRVCRLSGSCQWLPAACPISLVVGLMAYWFVAFVVCVFRFVFLFWTLCWFIRSWMLVLKTFADFRNQQYGICLCGHNCCLGIIVSPFLHLGKSFQHQFGRSGTPEGAMGAAGRTRGPFWNVSALRAKSCFCCICCQCLFLLTINSNSGRSWFKHYGFYMQRA